MVIRSEFSGVQVGDHIYGILREFLNYLSIPRIRYTNVCVYIHLEAFKNYFIKDNLDDLSVIENPHNLPWSTFVNVLGVPGKSSEYSSVIRLSDKLLFFYFRPDRIHGLERVF